MKALSLFAACGVVAAVMHTAAALGAEREVPQGARQTAWGYILTETERPHCLRLFVTNWPSNGELELTDPFPNLLGACLEQESSRKPLPLEFHADARRVTVRLPTNANLDQPSDTPPTIVVETIDKSQQLSDGRIQFSALDAEISGTSARLENQPGNPRLGSWTSADNPVRWNYRATRPGTYRVELTYSLDDAEGSEIAIAVGEQLLAAKLDETRNVSTYITIPLGT